MNILLIEPYDTGSHHAWLNGYRQASRHHVDVLSMPGQFWKWRLQGGAVTLARLFNAGTISPDIIVATDMLDLSSFLALTRPRTARIPVALYFHENQLTYPMGPRQRKEVHFQLGLINYTSALAADALFFNSQFHLESFFDELPRLLKHYPDYNELENIDLLRRRAAVLPLGLDLRRLDAHRPVRQRDGPPLVLWNHRWEHDKNPRPFLNAVVRLAEEGVDFAVAITGENFRQDPSEFTAAREALGERAEVFGYVESFAAYARLLWDATVQVSTANHEFFGISTCEAIYCGCLPLLPHRLNYPALLPPEYHDLCLYREGELYYRLRERLGAMPLTPPALRRHVSQFDWGVMAPRYDEVLAGLAARHG